MGEAVHKSYLPKAVEPSFASYLPKPFSIAAYSLLGVPCWPETEACTLPPADPSVGGPTGAAAAIHGFAAERLRLLQPALGLQPDGEVADAVQGVGMPVSQHGAAWGTLQPGEDFRLQEAS